MSSVDKTKVAASSKKAKSTKQASSKKFPTSVRELRRKYPNGTIVRASFTTASGKPVEYEGKLNEQFMIFARALLDAAAAN